MSALVWLPSGQLKQLSLNACGAYLPYSHDWQILEFKLNSPATQSLHKVRSVVDSFPGLQFVHVLDPRMLLYCPIGQKTQSLGHGGALELE